MTFSEYCKSLEEKIQASYVDGVTLENAERLAGEFLHAQLKVSAELKTQDLDARMQKSGLKAVKAGAYKAATMNVEKKPTEAAIQATVDTDKTVGVAQDSLDAAEVSRDELERYYSIFREAHIFYRGVSKGRFD